MKTRSLAVVALLACSCAGPSASHKKEMNQQLARREYAAAIIHLDQDMDSEYGKSSQVLYLLDKGALLHFAGRYAESDLALDQAELKIDDLFTKSVTQGVGQFTINDNTSDYRGPAYEKVLLHLLRALNYVFLNRPDDAVVEARKMSNFLARLGDGSAGGNYKDDLLVHVLSQLLFEDSGRPDDVAVSSRLAYAMIDKLGSSNIKPELDPKVFEQPMGAGEGELILVHYNGPAPRIDSQTVQVAWGQAMVIVQTQGGKDANAQLKNALTAGLAGNAITVAYPKFAQDPFRIAGSKIVVNGVESKTMLAEDISALANMVLTENADAIRTRAVVRATIKFIVAKIAEKVAKEQLGGTAGALVGFGARMGAAASEIADTRVWNTIAAQIRLGHMHVPSGTHQVKIVYVDAKGATVLEESYPAVVIVPGKRSYIQVRTLL